MGGGAEVPDRFVVTAIGGYTIRPGTARHTSKKEGVSYSVIDTAACCREVGKFYYNGTPGYLLRRQAEHLCAELNAEEAEYEARHA